MRNKIFKILLGIVFLISVYAIYLGVSIYNYSMQSQNPRADAALVLGAAAWNDQPSPVFEERIKHALSLYDKGIVKHLIFTGGKGKGKIYSEAEVAKKYAMTHSIPEHVIFMETESKITKENIANAMDIVQQKGFKRVILVSDPLHMRRAMAMAQAYPVSVYSSPTPTSKYQSFKSKSEFLVREVFFYMAFQVNKLIQL